MKRWLWIFRPEVVFWAASVTATGFVIISIAALFGIGDGGLDTAAAAIAAIALGEAYALLLGYARVPACQACAEVQATLRQVQSLLDEQGERP